MKANKFNSTNGETINDAIALVGIGCRFPGGAHNPESFWELLKKGEDAIVDVPPDRWNLRRFYDSDPNKTGKMYIKQGGFLQQPVNEFDASFFGITPREADCMDPQQRLLLEVSWEALEDAGIPYESLVGSNTGVFIGAFTLDHMLTQMGKMNRDLVGIHTAIGSTMTILSNRISYTLDLRGPSLSLDTACSSSLVAFHLACQSIWRSECDLALVGGVNVMMRPEYPIAMCKGGFLAPDGRSKSFDADANGYGRGEGAGVVVLKPLAVALRDGDSIYALVRGTGANQDGRTNGITVPNPKSQAALIKNVCEKYAIDTSDICYFEAHGTGTPVGDPLEAQALGEVIGLRAEQDGLCIVGSVKASIGHLEAAAGVAAVIKTALCLSHRMVTPQANLKTPNPNIPFAQLGLRLADKLEPLAPDMVRVCAGVNSFGYGGTNAHAILENAPALPYCLNDDNEHGRVYLLPLSARSEEALTGLAKAWLNRFTKANEPNFKDLCYSAACRRGHHSHRMAIAAESITELREQLQAFIESGAGEWLATAKISGEAMAKPVFVYTGMGPQWWAMGRELYHSEPVYREAVDSCDALFRSLAGWSILDAMLADEQDSRISDTEIAQPANFLIQVGLTAIWRSLGIEPAAIVGHSVGEVSAAYASGVLSLSDAVKVSYHRSRIQKKASGHGKMLAVGLSEEQCAELLELTEGAVSIAAVNSHASVTLAGDAHSLEVIAAYLTELGEFNRFLQVEVAYHSHFMEPLKPELREALAQLTPSLPSIPLYSTYTGDLVEVISYDAEYWCNNIREPVYFAKAMASLLRDGHRVFLEVGPHPVLSTAIRECCRQQNIQPQTFASLRREKPELRTLNLALAGLYTAGCNINWQSYYPDDARYVKLPNYPWQREAYWRESEKSMADRIGSPLHPLLDRRLPDPRPTWQSAINRQFLPYLDDHRVDGLVVMPGAVYVEAGLALHRQLNQSGVAVIEQLRFHQALVLDENSVGEPTIHISLDEKNGNYVFSSHDYDDPVNWRLHASGRIVTATEPVSVEVDLNQLKAHCPEVINISTLYANLSERGLHYGDYFQAMRQLQRCQSEVLARIELHPDLMTDAAAYQLHPCLLDGCFQSLIAALEADDKFYMPVAIERIAYYQAPGTAFWCHGKLTTVDEQGIEGDLILFNDQGELLLKVEGLHCRALAANKENMAEQVAQWVYAWRWLAQDLQPTGARTGCWLLFSDATGIGKSLKHELEANIANQVIEIPSHEVYLQETTQLKPLNKDELSHLRDVLLQAKAASCTGIVYLWGLNAGQQKDDPVGINQVGTALEVIQLLGEVFDANAPRLYIVTQGVQPVIDENDVVNMAQTPLVGLARVAFNEYPELRCTLVDLDTEHTEAQLDLLRQELLADDLEDDVALRGLNRFVHRLEHLTPDIQTATIETSQVVNSEDVDVFFLNPKDLMHFYAMPLPLPGHDEVVVEVKCINLTDIAFNADDNDQKQFNYFATGVICDLGAGVTNWHKGEQVIIVVKDKLASHLVCSSLRVFSIKPFQNLAHEEIAALTTTLVPAYYALRHVARVAAKETVLIDASAGVVALAANCVSHWLQAYPLIYIKDAKHPSYSSNAFDEAQLVDADNLDFVQSLIAEGEITPVRVCLHGTNTPSWVSVDDLLAPDAHEIALTTTGVDEPVLRDRDNGAFTRVNALKLACTVPDLFNALLEDVGRHLESVQKNLLPVHKLSAQEGSTYLSKQNDSGLARDSVILSMHDKTGIRILSEPIKKTLFDAGASYLITGGFGGFGLEAAQWLGKQGAKNLILVGRRGAADEAAKVAVQNLENSGIQVMAVAADMSDALK